VAIGSDGIARCILSAGECRLAILLFEINKAAFSPRDAQTHIKHLPQNVIYHQAAAQAACSVEKEAQFFKFRAVRIRHQAGKKDVCGAAGRLAFNECQFQAGRAKRNLVARFQKLALDSRAVYKRSMPAIGVQEVKLVAFLENLGVQARHAKIRDDGIAIIGAANSEWRGRDRNSALLPAYLNHERAKERPDW